MTAPKHRADAVIDSCRMGRLLGKDGGACHIHARGELRPSEGRHRAAPRRCICSSPYSSIQCVACFPNLGRTYNAEATS